MDTLRRTLGFSRGRQQASSARYTSLHQAGEQRDGEVLFQSEEDGDAERGDQVPLSERTRSSHPEREEGDIEEEVSDEHAAFVHEHASHRPRRRRGAAVNVKVSTLIKALAALFALWGLWMAMKLSWAWFIAPKKSPTMSIPVFGENLGCNSAPYFYKSPNFPLTSTNHTVLTLPLSTPEGENSFLLRTQGSNTFLTVTLERQPDVTITALIVHAAFSSPEANMDFSITGTGPTFDSAPHLTYEALPDAAYCIRMDVILFLPGNLRSLTLDLQNVAHVRVGDSWGNGHDAFAPALRNMSITLHASSVDNLILPSPGLTAELTKLALPAGYIGGEHALARSLEIDTVPEGEVDLSLRVLTSQAGTGWSTGKLETHAGKGRSKFRVQVMQHLRCFSGEHQSEGDLELEYEGFEGRASWVAGNGLNVDGVGEGGEVGGGGCDELRVNCGGKLDLRM